jgi:hypothetical protein
MLKYNIMAAKFLLSGDHGLEPYDFIALLCDALIQVVFCKTCCRFCLLGKYLKHYSYLLPFTTAPVLRCETRTILVV